MTARRSCSTDLLIALHFPCDVFLHLQRKIEGELSHQRCR